MVRTQEPMMLQTYDASLMFFVSIVAMRSMDVFFFFCMPDRSESSSLYVCMYGMDQRSTLCCGKQQLLCRVLRAHIYTPNPTHPWPARGERKQKLARVRREEGGEARSGRQECVVGVHVDVERRNTSLLLIRHSKASWRVGHTARAGRRIVGAPAIGRRSVGWGYRQGA